MSDFSPILVLQIKICIKPDRHGKGSNKIWETLSFWRNIFNYGAIWLQTLICNRLNPRYEMQAVWLSIQRNHPFAYERLFLWRHMHRGYDLLYPRQSLRLALRWHLCAQRVEEGGTGRHWVWTELHSCWEMESRFPFLLGCLPDSRTVSFCFSFSHVTRYAPLWKKKLMAR